MTIAITMQMRMTLRMEALGKDDFLFNGNSCFKGVNAASNAHWLCLQQRLHIPACQEVQDPYFIVADKDLFPYLILIERTQNESILHRLIFHR